MKKLALLFDLDGTLVDSIELLLQSMEFAFDTRAHRPSRAQWTAGIGTPLRTQLSEWATGASDAELLLNRYRDYQSGRLEELTSVYPGVVETLTWARERGHALGLVTSKGRGMTDRSLAHVGIAGLFDVVVTADATTFHKPNPEPVWHALNALGLPASSCLFVGDSTHDMQAGRSAGVTTAAACWGPFSRAELVPSAPTYWLESMPDLPPLVCQLELSH